MSGSLTEDVKAWEELGKKAWAAATPGGAKILALMKSEEEAQEAEGVEEEKEEEGGDEEEEVEALGEMMELPLRWDVLVAALVMLPPVPLLLHSLPILLLGESKELEPGSVGRKRIEVPPPKRAGLQSAALCEAGLACGPSCGLAYPCYERGEIGYNPLLEPRILETTMVGGNPKATAPYH